MDNKQKLIWQYLDGELAPNRRAEVEQKILTDPSYIAVYNSAAKLHSSLIKMPLESAPDNMMQLIMDNIADEKIYVTKKTSFSGLKYLLGGFAGLNALLLAYLLYDGSIQIAQNTADIDYLEKLTAPMRELQFQLPDVTSSLLPYGLALGMMMVLFWADLLSNKLRPIRSKA